jgi:glycosyltransferase involved in cell wall biosynthesis
MKLIIQIPCLNEEQTLPATIADLPRQLDGIDTIELLVIDDGSSDRTVEVARAAGVEHVVRLTNNKGLAAGFQAGLDACLKLGADIVVNTDADNQYQGADVAKLVAPILAGEADMVVGDRQVGQIEHFSGSKKGLQRLGSWVVRRLSGTEITDTTSGFRAYNREAALQLSVVDNFTYTLESLIQAGKMLVAVDQVEIGTNPQTRESRLFASTGAYVRRNGPAILRIYARYEPLRAFATAGVVVLLLALLAWLPFLFIAAVQLFALGIIGDLLAGQRVMTQRVFERVRRVELALGVEPSHYERGSEPKP